MRKDLLVKTRTMAGTSDLTLFAHIIPGLVPAIEALSYKSRVKTVLRTLNGSRASSLEYAMRRPFSDAVERVGVIHSVRVVINEEAGLVMLAATFDGNFESYMRVLWQKVGPMLDVIFCSTINYPLAAQNSYETWMNWCRSVQVETDFFYATPGLTFDDVQYLKRNELLARDSPADAARRDLAASRQHNINAEERAWAAATAGLADTPPNPLNALDAARQGVQALTQLYKLTDLFPPDASLPAGHDDAAVLQRAARGLLLELVQLQALLPRPDQQTLARFSRQLDWLAQAAPERPVPPLSPPVYDPADVQYGILSGPDRLSHGAMLLVGLDTQGAGAALLAALLPQLTRDGQTHPDGTPYISLSITYEGLRKLGLKEDELSAFPIEFRQGMDARASLLGDARINHPRRWRLPLRNWPVPTHAAAEVELAAVHLIVQLRVHAPGNAEFEPGAPAHPLHAKIKEIASVHTGARLLSVQAMRRRTDAAGNTREHFGFVDGISQPQLAPDAGGAVYPNRVPLGDLLVGYANEADGPADIGNAADPWQHNGSFLALRKLSQNVPRLESAIAEALKQAPPGVTRELLLAKLMGRELDGKPLAATDSDNDFDFKADPDGKTCPFAAHIRRVNPRGSGGGLHAPPGSRHPRIMRRGMSYGPPYNLAEPPTSPNNAQPRGLYFMAYGATLAEQVETVQRWVSGANSSGAFSAHADPFMGVPRDGERRTLRFEHDGVPVRVELDMAGAQAAYAPIVRLEWGMYLFTPSLKALQKLQTLAATAPSLKPAWDLAEGARQLHALTHRHATPEAWKLALEDSEARRLLQSAALWAAVRQYHGGILRTPYGVLVASHELATEVFQDRDHMYSVAGYNERMDRSIGEIYLGLDNKGPSCPYHREASTINAAISAISMQQAFDSARATAGAKLAAMLAYEDGAAKHYGLPSWELNLDLREISEHVLAELCKQWFGLGEDAFFKSGGAPLDTPAATTPPLRYPGHFTAPSRYIFQPHPQGRAEALGQSWGQALRRSMAGLVETWKSTPPTAPIAAAIHAASLALFPQASQATARADWQARNMVGVLMGMLPTADGQLRAALNEWLVDGTFWRLRTALAQQGTVTLVSAQKLLLPELIPAMQLRPVPELVWRRAAHEHHLGNERIHKGEQVIVGIVSASHEKLAAGAPELRQIFGGQPGGNGHACPGYEAAMGILLGCYVGILECPATMRPAPAPLSLVFTGATTP
ncbi:MAG TPA: hypothetical protein VGE47_13725 [Burkholderiaceae bacterium]